jgi:hypothetical protein
MCPSGKLLCSRTIVKTGLVQNPRFLGNNTDRERGCPG